MSVGQGYRKENKELWDSILPQLPGKPVYIDDETQFSARDGPIVVTRNGMVQGSSQEYDDGEQ